MVRLPLGFTGMANANAAAIKRLRLFQRNFLPRINKQEVLRVRVSSQELISLITNGIPSPSFHSLAVIIEHFFEWPAINHRIYLPLHLTCLDFAW